MRDLEHYRRLLDENPRADVGFSLAASAIYAARHGVCDAEHHGTAEFRELARDLRQRYGETLTVDQVRAELAEGIKGDPGGWTIAAPESVETLTLTTAHSASSYGVPVLLIDGAGPYGPGDMTPQRMTGAELVAWWAARFTGGEVEQ